MKNQHMLTATRVQVRAWASTIVSETKGCVKINHRSTNSAVFDARRSRADANYRLQRANSRTDPTVFAGPRVFGNGDVALVAGFSLPLPNRALNRANIDRAAAEQRQVEADLESGLARFIIRRDNRFLANFPEEGKNRFGRPLFQNLLYSDTPTQPLVALQFTDSKAEPDKTYTYRVIAVNTVGLKSEPSAPAASVNKR